ncbi:MAG: polymer-forming cytoskeletal protein [Alphaproteobacteria bacterium]
MSISNIKNKVVNHNFKINENSFEDNSLKKLEILSNFKSTPTIISKDLKIQGELYSGGIIEIQGAINGTINGNSVILREDGTVTGAVFAENFNIRGRFEGNIKAKFISISSKAKVRGEVEYETLSVEDGANIDGYFKKI